MHEVTPHGDSPEEGQGSGTGDAVLGRAVAIKVPVLVPVLIFALAIVGSLIGLDLASYVSGSSSSIATSNLTAVELFGDLAGLWVVLLGGSYFCSRHWGTGSLKKDLGLYFRASDVIVGSIVGVAGQLLLVPLIYLIYQTLTGSSIRSLSAPAQNLVNAGQGASTVLVGFLIVIGAPLVEEIFFRGLVLRSLLGRTSAFGGRASTFVAVVGSALLFTVAHLEGLQSFGLFALGLILGYMAARSGRIGATVFAHASFNLVSFVALVHR